MKDSDIRRYAELMKELDLTALEINENGVRLERTPIAVAAAPVSAPVQSAPAAAVTAAADDGSFVVRSPIVGVFYAAPAENSEPFVSLGDKIEQGKTLCIIEAMKMMNEITAEVGGEIAEICVTNGQVVEYGTPLFKIRRA